MPEWGEGDVELPAEIIRGSCSVARNAVRAPEGCEAAVPPGRGGLRGPRTSAPTKNPFAAMSASASNRSATVSRRSAMPPAPHPEHSTTGVLDRSDNQAQFSHHPFLTSGAAVDGALLDSGGCPSATPGAEQ